MAKFKAPSQAVLDARARRGAVEQARNVRIEWFIDNVSNKIKMTLAARVKLATDLVKNKTVQNISRPVTVGVSSRGKRKVVDRSKPGEFPKVDTGTLRRTIFSGVQKIRTGYEGWVGTPLKYGAILEMSERLDRSYLRRTLNEEHGRVKKILTGPIK